MSSTLLIEFRDNLACEGRQYKNSWGGAARIWTGLFDRYCRDPNIPYDNWLTATMPRAGREQDRRLWDLWLDIRLSNAERAVLLFTFDNALVKQADFAKMAKHCFDFADMYPTMGVDHLPAWGELFAASTADWIGLWVSTVDRNPWVDITYTKSDDPDEPALVERRIPYNLGTGDRHWDVFDRMAANPPDSRLTS